MQALRPAFCRRTLGFAFAGFGVRTSYGVAHEWWCGVTADQRVQDAIACWVAQFDQLLEVERQAKRITVDFDNGLRLRVSRKKVELGSKNDLVEVTDRAREDAARMRREDSTSQIERQCANEEDL